MRNPDSPCTRPARPSRPAGVGFGARQIGPVIAEPQCAAHATIDGALYRLRRIGRRHIEKPGRLGDKPGRNRLDPIVIAGPRAIGLEVLGRRTGQSGGWRDDGESRGEEQGLLHEVEPSRVQHGRTPPEQSTGGRPGERSQKPWPPVLDNDVRGHGFDLLVVTGTAREPRRASRRKNCRARLLRGRPGSFPFPWGRR